MIDFTSVHIGQTVNVRLGRTRLRRRGVIFWHGNVIMKNGVSIKRLGVTLTATGQRVFVNGSECRPAPSAATARPYFRSRRAVPAATLSAPAPLAESSPCRLSDLVRG